MLPVPYGTVHIAENAAGQRRVQKQGAVVEATAAPSGRRIPGAGHQAPAPGAEHGGEQADTERGQQGRPSILPSPSRKAPVPRRHSSTARMARSGERCRGGSGARAGSRGAAVAPASALGGAGRRSRARRGAGRRSRAQQGARSRARARAGSPCLSRGPGQCQQIAVVHHDPQLARRAGLQAARQIRVGERRQLRPLLDGRAHPAAQPLRRQRGPRRRRVARGWRTSVRSRPAGRTFRWPP